MKKFLIVAATVGMFSLAACNQQTPAAENAVDNAEATADALDNQGDMIVANASNAADAITDNASNAADAIKDTAANAAGAIKDKADDIRAAGANAADAIDAKTKN